MQRIHPVGETRYGGGFYGGDIIRTTRYLFVILGLVLLAVPVIANGIPTAAFIANVTDGPAPLPVRFTNQSSLNADGWAWFFGDETFTEPWTLVNASSGWLKRIRHTSVTMPDGSIVLTGGFSVSGNGYNDTWRSTDNGTHWTRMNASWGLGRYSHTSIALPDGTIMVMAGLTDYSRNDVWNSTDYGAHWTLVNNNAPWIARTDPSSVVLPDGSIVLSGGEFYGIFLNDTWRSTDKGVTWTAMNASSGSGWPGRYYHTSVVLPDGSIVLMGGVGSGYVPLNDTWRSTDKGAHWTLVNASSGWTARQGHASVALPDGSIVLMGGFGGTSYLGDMWRSADAGTTWTPLPDPVWNRNGLGSSVVLPDGSILVTGGYDGSDYTNKTWRLLTAGSSEKSPVHTYTVPGTYTVTLQVYNGAGHNSTRKAGYIRVTGPADVGVFRPAAGKFFLKNGAGTMEIPFGKSGDTPVSGDWNWDGKTEVGVHRAAAQKFLLKNGSEDTVVRWGLTTDTGVAGDWNGDGMGDIGVHRAALQKFVLKNGSVKTIVKWGLATDLPVAGDWNGDGMGDIGVFRPSTQQFMLKNGTVKTTISWGLPGDIPVAGDWNNDGLSDVGVFRPAGQKFILKNGTEMTKITFGESTDLPVAGEWI